jgi:hypothetical protein
VPCSTIIGLKASINQPKQKKEQPFGGPSGVAPRQKDRCCWQSLLARLMKFFDLMVLPGWPKAETR